MAAPDWKLRLERFFYDRGLIIAGVPTLHDHCIISAKDPRISGRSEMHADTIASIVEALKLDSTSDVLEVGCASGYIACGLAAYVGRYTGVDLATTPLEVARRMGLSNAEFVKGDGASLPFENGKFDAAFAYDVFTSFPNFEDGIPIIREMLRVVRPGGMVMIGSLTDKKKREGFERRLGEVTELLLAEYGPQPVPVPKRLGLVGRLTQALRRQAPNVPPEVVFYYFDLDQFRDFARSEGVKSEILGIHRMNPYVGFRYNVIYTKGAA